MIVSHGMLNSLCRRVMVVNLMFNKKIIFLFFYIMTPLASLYTTFCLFSLAWKTNSLIVGLIGSIVSALFFIVDGVYNKCDNKNIYLEIILILRCWLVFGAIINSFLLAINIEKLTWHVLLTWVLITPFCLIFCRVILDKIIKKEKVNVLIVNNEYQFTPHEFKKLKAQGIKLIECKNEEPGVIEECLSEFSIHYVVVNTQSPNSELIKYLTKKNTIQYCSIEHFMENVLRKCYIPYGKYDLIYLDDINPYNKNQLIIKTLVNLIGIIILFLFSLFALAITIIKIKSQSPGKIIFRQARVGLNGKEFVINKFRSMGVDAEKQGAQFSRKNDPRAFPFGRFMRKTRIDELPQIINIIKKDIDLIGPRAERRVFIKKLEKEIPYYNKRHIVKPGITGWAQINYPYGITTEDSRQKLMYDLYYIKHWSLALELEVVIKTIKVIMMRQGI